MAGGAGFMCLQETRNVKLGKIVGMRKQKRLTLQPIPVRKRCPAGAKERFFVHKVNPRSPSGRSNMMLDLTCEPMRIDQDPFYPCVEEKIKPIVEQRSSIDLDKAFW
jgi:hypothetical protein